VPASFSHVGADAADATSHVTMYRGSPSRTVLPLSRRCMSTTTAFVQPAARSSAVPFALIPSAPMTAPELGPAAPPRFSSALGLLNSRTRPTMATTVTPAAPSASGTIFTSAKTPPTYIVLGRSYRL